jgi:NDP-sugar pyrophosphorylase family protein
MVQGLEGATAAILAGGLGTRLRSCIADRPKVLAPVRGRPYLSYLLEQLADVGVRHVVLLTGYLANKVHSTFGDSYADMRLTYSEEPSPLGTAGALRQALPHLLSPTVPLLNGDSYCETSLADFWEAHHRKFADVSLVLARREDCSRFGRVQTAADGRVSCFEEKKQAGGAGWINAGIYLIQRAAIEEIPLGQPLSLERDLFPEWIDRKRFWSFANAGRFLDIGTPESYAQAESFFAPTNPIG